ncbi:hypothetical protein Lalb_Chr04g0251631 [Lupinus albus]|uniref:Uncharacterized protein n=1 Tax=Lupinus albus TaxID=3870 RepID=A0A6A4QM75_LUPAL|nr:hypothetical protein Lalb_Chr04g0251631 [Lupinus albus]
MSSPFIPLSFFSLFSPTVLVVALDFMHKGLCEREIVKICVRAPCF